jgi:uncharacterized protein (DUF302 family)
MNDKGYRDPEMSAQGAGVPMTPPIITTAYTFSTSVPMSVAQARPLVEAALKAEGFGVLTEIDVAATMKAKLGVDGPPYVILGACNPPLAHRALEADSSVGVLLPCNVVLREHDGRTIVEAMDPGAILGIANSSAIEPVAREAQERLLRAIQSVSSESNNG